MRLLLIHCKKIGFKDIRKSNRPMGINHTEKKLQNYKDVLAVFICIEKWDGENEINQGIQIIEDHLKIVKRNHIIIVPFAHLSYYLAEPQKSIVILEQISSECKKRGIYIEKSSFGYHKELNLEISELLAYGHPGSVAFRRLPNDIELELKNYIMEYGIDKTKKLINGLYKG